MKWTKVPPTRYGLYWVKYEDNADDIVEVIENTDKSLLVVFLGDNWMQPMNKFVEEYHQPSWYGPLEAPQEK